MKFKPGDIVRLVYWLREKGGMEDAFVIDGAHPGPGGQQQQWYWCQNKLWRGALAEDQLEFVQ